MDELVYYHMHVLIFTGFIRHAHSFIHVYCPNISTADVHLLIRHCSPQVPHMTI